MRLEEKFRLDDLLRLEELFTNHNLPAVEAVEVEETTEARTFPLKRHKPKAISQQVGNMTLKEFQNVLSNIFESESWDDNMELLFNKVDTSCDGFIDWSEFCTYLLLQYKEQDYMTTRKITLLKEPVIRLCTRNKQEPTCRILAVSSPPPLWFMSISKGGVLTAWDINLHPQKSYEITVDPLESQTGKRRFKSWATDAVYLPNVHKIAVATTSRDIHFFDVFTMNIFEEYHLCALIHVPTCFYYWYNIKIPGSHSLLLWGDDKGGVSLLWLLKPSSGMFEKVFTHQMGPHKVYMQELRQHSKFLSYQYFTDIHPEAINKIMYVPGQDLIITSSDSSQTSVVIMDINSRGKTYMWKISKGVQCFDYCKSLNLLVTGGLDHKVRLWNQYVPSRPIALLQEHTMAILDVAIYEPLKQIFSYSKDSVLKVWDISSHRCLQTLVLKFPCLHPGRTQEQGSFPFLLVQMPPHRLLVSFSDYIGMLCFAHTDTNEETLTTHEAPLSGVLYNSFFHQVVTGSEDSSVAVWDVETGNKSLLLNNVHGQEEITCMTFDNSQRKLITGARNGTIKIWNIQNGHNLHRLQPVEEAEVTCVLSLKEKKFLSVGWNRKIVIYDITEIQNTYVSADESWKGGHLHREDILAADHCPSLGLLVTASFDGEIIVWNTETQRMYLHLRDSSKQRRPNTGGRAVVLRPMSRYRQRRQSCDIRCYPPVDKVYFLQHRTAQKDAAILISSEAGILRWWSIFTHHRKFSYFYAPSNADESVFGLTSDESNSVLVSGDTAGYIQVWDISQYGFQATDQEEEKRPPLLFSWSAHDSTVVGMEHFMFGTDQFIISGSSDRTAKLWTCDGKLVGIFGQSKNWNLRNPSTFLHNTTGDPGEIEDKGPLSERQATSGDKPAVGPQGHIEEMGRRYEMTVSKDPLVLLEEKAAERTWKMSVTDNEENKLQIAVDKKVRRHLATDIDVNKCNRFGQLCSPFQALNMTEIQDIELPKNFPKIGTGNSLEWGDQQQETQRNSKSQGRQISQILQARSLQPH
ncbi:WD repeat-containing protein on Y chromosome-like [Pseudophryne corroboree]|uniref:WD repeat-containing protein on Y chromosome-like n=1 Tax=Pseudophryne corroboree TaxID=495146 RepID=UPI0030818377